MGSVYRQTGRCTWMVKVYARGLPIVRSSGSADRDDAVRLMKQLEGDLAHGMALSRGALEMLVSDALDLVVDDYRLFDRASVDELERRIRLHLVPGFRGRRLHQVTAGEIRSFAARRKAAGASNGEINRELSHLSRAFVLAAEHCPGLRKPRIVKLPEATPRQGFVTEDQVRAIGAGLPAELAAIVVVAFITGWRMRDEVQTLTWSQVDLEARLNPAQTTAGVLRLARSKNAEPRVFPMTAWLRETLLERRQRRDELRGKGLLTPYVFVRLRKRRTRQKGLVAEPVKAFQKRWQHACDAAGCPELIPHDLRRSAVMNLIRAGVSEKTAQQLTGHKTNSVFKRYLIVADVDLAQAASRLDALSR